MTDREKLIDLLDNTGYFINREVVGYVANKLLANGVVVREWIPVTERLPERHGCYIVTACDEGCPYGEGIWYDTVVVTAEYYDGCWLWYEGQTEYDLCDIVTHWMPLPEKPKEGE